MQQCDNVTELYIFSIFNFFFFDKFEIDKTNKPRKQFLIIIIIPKEKSIRHQIPNGNTKNRFRQM